MDLAPQNLAVRFYAGQVSISVVKTPLGKNCNLLSLPYYLISQIRDYFVWFERTGNSKLEARHY